MTMLMTCPSCGLDSAEVRCPRCNTLKVLGCSGACSRCSNSCSTGPVPVPPAQRPSDEATDDAEHSGTPLTR